MTIRLKIAGLPVLMDDDIYTLIKGAALSIAPRGKHSYVELYVFGRRYYLHRVVMNVRRGEIVDHINRRKNLRLCKQHQNLSNRGLQKNNQNGLDNTVGFKGVSYHGPSRSWRATVKHRGELYSCGYHRTAEEAARHYNLKAKELFGEFVCFNNVKPLFPGVRPLPRHNTSGYRGVSFCNTHKRWLAFARINGKNKTRGRFRTLADAVTRRATFNVSQNLSTRNAGEAR